MMQQTRLGQQREQAARAIREYLRRRNIQSPTLSVDSDGLTLWGSLACTREAYTALREIGYRLLQQRKRKGVRILRMYHVS